MLSALRTNKAVGLFVSILPSVIKITILRSMGMDIDAGVRIGFASAILCSEVKLEKGARIGNFCLIRARRLHMGKRSEIQNLNKIAVHTLIMKSQSVICSSNEIAGDLSDDRSELYLGPASWILQRCYVNVVRKIRLGRNVGVGGGSYVFTHGLWLSKLDGFPVAYGEITIENDVWLPWGCFLLPSITIGTRAIIGARSVVNRSIPAGALAAGVPAKVIREKSWQDLTDEDRADLLGELTHDYGQRLKLKVDVVRNSECELHYLDGKLILALHKKLEAPSLYPSPTLNVIYGPLVQPHDAKVLLWSLNDYASSPYSELSQSARDWLAHARSIGARYYPIDEDQD